MDLNVLLRNGLCGISIEADPTGLHAAFGGGREVGPVSFKSEFVLSTFARRVLEARAKCAQFFPREVFRDAAWDMMLEIFIAREEGRQMCVKHVVLASGESSTGAMRRIEGLEDAQLIKRVPDPVDHRRVHVELTASGHGAMTALLKHLYSMDWKTRGEGAVRAIKDPGQE